MLRSKTYREFSRQHYNRWKHEYPGMRESELVSKIINAWEKMSDQQKKKMEETYLEKNYITEDLENSEEELEILKVAREAEEELLKNRSLQSILLEEQQRIKKEKEKRMFKNIGLEGSPSKDQKNIRYKNEDEDYEKDKKDDNDDDEEEKREKSRVEIKYIAHPQEYKVVHYYLDRLTDKKYPRSVIYYAHRVAEEVTAFLNQLKEKYTENHDISSERRKKDANSDEFNPNNSENSSEFEVEASEKEKIVLEQQIIENCLVFTTVAFFSYYNKQVAEQEYYQSEPRPEPQYTQVQPKFLWHLQFNIFYAELNKRIQLPLLIRQKTISFIWQTIKRQLLIMNFDKMNPEIDYFILPANKMHTEIEEENKKKYLQILALPTLIDLPKKENLRFPEIEAPNTHFSTPILKKLSKKQRNELKKAEKRQKK